MRRELLMPVLFCSVPFIAGSAAFSISPVKWVPLWTDLLVYLLLVMVAMVVGWVRSQPYMLAPWQQVMRSRIASACLVVLLGYAAIGLLDSVHFRQALPQQQGQGAVQYDGEVLSLLDVLAGPLRTQVEKTYSAPLATHLYAMETGYGADGSMTRDYPRLQYGGTHLVDPTADKWGDIAGITAVATAQALTAWLALCGLLIVWLARSHDVSWSAMLLRVWRGECSLHWNVLLATLGVLMALGFVAAQLGVNYHLLGTDKVGQDVFYLCLKSVRTGLLIGTLTTLVMLPFALALGIAAGYFRGWIDDVIQYIYTTLSAIPDVLLIAAAVLIMQAYMGANPEMFETMAERADARLLFLCLILGVTSWTGLCRLLRGEALKLRELDYVSAAQAFGVPRLVILVRHILPNVLHVVLITVVLGFSGLVLAEAVLSYVGVGVDPSMASWGNMINGARLEMAREPMVWWSLLGAFMFMFVLVLAANLFSDAVRDAFDPHGRG